jgi:hypothetical protein
MPPPKRALKVPNVKTASKTPSKDTFDYPSSTEINEPPNTFDSYVRCIYGQKGFGKSTLASQFPNSLTLMYEPMRRGLRIRQLPIRKVLASQILDGAADPWVQLKNTTQQWIDDTTIDNINFDSVDIAYETAYHSICASHEIENPAQAGKGSSDIWIEIRDEWSSYFDSLIASRLGVNLISHVKTRDIEELDGSKQDVKVPSCSPACLTYIKQACDFVFYYGQHNGYRAIQVRNQTGSSFVSCGPEGHFMQPDGKPIQVLAMPALAEKKNGYMILSEAFNNTHWDIDTSEDDRKITTTPKKGPPPKRKP